MKGKIVLVSLFILLTPLASSSLSDWSQFQNDIDKCASDGVCTTSDSFNLQFRNSSIYIDSGDTGYCGVGGATRQVSLNQNPHLSLESRAYLDYWAGDVGIKVNNNWVKRYTFAGNGENAGTSDYQQLDFNLSEYSGEKVNISFVIQDKSPDWCNMGDHDAWLSVRNIDLDRGEEENNETENNETEDNETEDEEPKGDLSDIPQLFSDAKVVAPSAGVESEKEVANEISDIVDSETISPDEVYPSMDGQNLIIVGGPAINSRTQKLVEEGKALPLTQYEYGTYRFNLVHNRSGEGGKALIISGYGVRELRAASDKFEKLWNDEEQREELEGEMTVEYEVEENQDLVVEKITYRKTDSGNYEIGALIRNTGSETTFDGSFVPYKDFEVKNDEGELKEKYELEKGLNWVNRTLNPDFIPSESSFSLDKGELETITIYGKKYSFKLVNIEGTSKAILEVEGELQSVNEGETFSLDGRAMKAESVVRTGEESGFVQLRPGRRPDREVKVGIEVEPVEGEDNVQNNKRVITIPIDKSEEKQKTGVSIKLQKGWNLVSVPRIKGSDQVSQEGFYAEELAETCNLREYQGEKFWRYEDGGWSHENSLALTEAVFINAEKPCKATINRTWSTGNPENPWNTLEKGWNMISVVSPKTVSEIEGTCNFQEYGGAPAWQYSGGEWKKLGFSDQMNPKKGYYVKVSERCKIKKEPETNPPTPSGNFFEQATGWLN